MKTSQEMHLIVNPGSTSTCYVLFQDNQEMAYAYFLNRFSSYEVQYRSARGEKKAIINKSDYEQSTLLFFNYLRQIELINSQSNIDAIGIRIVAPGTFFTTHRIIDKTFIQKLNNAVRRDPLHIAPLIKNIEIFRKLLPQTPMYGISDSAFHTTMSSIAKTYALPHETAQDLDIHRFGYHGIACSSIIEKIKKLNTPIPEKIIVCHLGGGTSITALKQGVSIDTSMGYSPLEGLPMSTRIGNIDANALLHIMQAYKFTTEQLRAFLYTKCGLLALSGKTGDMRQIEKLMKAGDQDCQNATDYYVYAVTKSIGGYAAVLQGLDLLILTGGISVHLPFIRTLICNKLAWHGIKIDEQKSNALIAQDGFIESPQSSVKIAVLAPDEEREMYEIVKKLAV